MSYEQFAQTYDALMDKSLYKCWENFVKQHVPTNQIILELACGTGDLANLLQKNYTVLASDLSESMLAIASQKYPKLQLFQADMCAVELSQPVDAVTCFADSICYLPDELAVQQAFSQAYTLLKQGGVYLFDVHSVYQMTHGYRDYTYQHVDEYTVFVWTSYLGEHDFSVEHDITCCIAQSSDSYTRYDETHYQRTYPLDSYLNWLKQAGFHSIEVSADFGETQVSETSTRWFFKAVK